jgi:hypothetical protein
VVDFPIFDAKSRSLKKAILGLTPRCLSPPGKTGGKIGPDQRIPIIEALNGITISLREGDRLGLVGHMAPVFDLGVGMDPEISGYENIIIRGLFLGMTRKQMQARVDDIAGRSWTRPATASMSWSGGPASWCSPHIPTTCSSNGAAPRSGWRRPAPRAGHSKAARDVIARYSRRVPAAMGGITDHSNVRRR